MGRQICIVGDDTTDRGLLIVCIKQEYDVLADYTALLILVDYVPIVACIESEANYTSC